MMSDGAERVAETPPQRTVITGVEIPFWELAGLIVKFVLACIPAGLLLFALWYVLALTM